MKRKTAHAVFGIILLLVLSLHTFLTLSSPVTPYDAHFLFREVEAIAETQLPFTNDTLSYQGRSHIFSLLFPYLATILYLVLGQSFLLFSLQVLLVGLLFVVTYRATQTLYERRWISLVLAGLLATNTVLFAFFRQAANPTHLFFIFYLLALVAFFKLPEKQASSLFAVFVVLATLTSPFILLLALAILVYLLLLYLERMQQRPVELETLGFSVVFIVWYHLLIYKDILAIFGTQALWQSIPTQLLSTFFQALTLPLFIQLIGLIPLLLGMYAMYEGLFIRRKRSVLFLISLTLVCAVLLLLGFLPITEGLAFTALHFILLSGYGLQRIITFFTKTKIPRARQWLAVSTVSLSFLLFIPLLLSLQQVEGVTPEEADFLSSLSLEDATILASLEEGHAIAYYTNQKNFYDTSFILAPNAQERFLDARKVFQSKSLVAIIELTDYYDITHIYVSPYTRNQYDTDIFFFETDDCFEPVQIEGQRILYEVTCSRK
jgi:hypothetical protein